MIGRPPTCECGECRKCKNRVRNRLRYQAMTLEERRAAITRRDQEKVRANDRARYYRHRDERLSRMQEWAQNNPEKAAALKREWAKRNPEKRSAHNEVWKALQSGRLNKLPCEVCGSEDVHAHHDDYSRPLDVRWLCAAHHSEQHRQYGEAA